jgi:hypothetical protein
MALDLRLPISLILWIIFSLERVERGVGERTSTCSLVHESRVRLLLLWDQNPVSWTRVGDCYSHFAYVGPDLAMDACAADTGGEYQHARGRTCAKGNTKRKSRGYATPNADSGSCSRRIHLRVVRRGWRGMETGRTVAGFRDELEEQTLVALCGELVRGGGHCGGRARWGWCLARAPGPNRLHAPGWRVGRQCSDGPTSRG